MHNCIWADEQVFFCLRYHLPPQPPSHSLKERKTFFTLDFLTFDDDYYLYVVKVDQNGLAMIVPVRPVRLLVWRAKRTPFHYDRDRDRATRRKRRRRWREEGQTT